MEKKEFLINGIIITFLAILSIFLPWINKTKFISQEMQEFSNLMWIGYTICIGTGISYILATIWNKIKLLEINSEILLGSWSFIIIIILINSLISNNLWSKFSAASSYFHWLYLFEMPGGSSFLETLYFSLYTYFNSLEDTYLLNTWFINFLPALIALNLNSSYFGRLTRVLKDEKEISKPKT